MKRIALFAAVLLAACASANVAPGEADAAMKASRNDFMQYARSGNAAALANDYADDAVLMPPNLPAMRGRAAIQQFWSGFMAAGKIDVTLTPEKVLSSGDLATDAGKYDLTITPANGAPIHDVGKYAVTSQKIGGQWKIVVDIFNSDQPPPR
jgi:ketosteroid isomerase-like protein